MPKINLSFKVFEDTNLRKNLNIGKMAMDDAGFGVPASNATDLSVTENKIAQHIRTFYDINIQKTGQNELEESIQTTSSKRESDGHDGQISSLKADLSTLYFAQKDKISGKHNKYIKARDQLSFFQKEHNLRSPADLKSFNYKMFSIAIVAAMFLFETATNTGFLTGALSGGLLGALSLAGVISFVNIVTSFLVGRYVIPNLTHKKKSKNNMSIVAISFYAPLILYINCSVGVLRSLLQNAQATMNSDDIAYAAVQAAWPFDNFATNSVQSNGLIIIGIVFAIIAILDGYNYDEPYPGYAKFTKDANDAEKDFESSKATCYKLLHDKQTKGNNQITDFKEQREAANNAWGDAIDSVQAGFSAYEAWIKGLNTAGNGLINEYRSENQRYRSTPTPGYFNEKVDFGLEKDANNYYFSLRSENISDDEKKLQMKDVTKIIIGEYNSAIEEVNSIYADFIDKFEDFKAKLEKNNEN
jgi:hypothetical protein